MTKYVAKPSENSEWKITVSDFVTQCYGTYPKFGEDTLATKIKAFMVGLEDYGIEEISYAFRHWLKENSKMPMPSEIGCIAKERAKHQREINSSEPARAAPRNDFKPQVPWFGKTWGEIQRDHMPELERHLVKLTESKGKEAASNYINYLKTMSGRTA